MGPEAVALLDTITTMTKMILTCLARLEAEVTNHQARTNNHQHSRKHLPSAQRWQKSRS